MSIDDPKKIKQLEGPFNHFLSGLFSVPIDLPGTQYNRGIKAGSSLRKEIRAAIKQRKHDLAENKGLVAHDILSHWMAAMDEEGRYISEPDLINMIVTLLLTSHDIVSTTITAVVKFLAEIPKQTEIARSKAKGELLTWDDIQKMNYSWNVVLETLRHFPTLQGSFRQALVEFDYGGFRIPKGWKRNTDKPVCGKGYPACVTRSAAACSSLHRWQARPDLYWSAYTTHLDPKYFPEPEKFNPMRFDKYIEPYTFVAFGGGPRTCPGRDYARLDILVFMHNLVNRFKLEKVLKDEKIVFNPTANPEHGLPILLTPHQM
ncbi:Beta-amyrin 28-monooxygenase-like protein [Drosera capensis]